MIALASCGTHGSGPRAPTAAPAPVAGPPPPGGLPALYARLFVVGATFTYDVTTHRETPADDTDGGTSTSDETAPATCQVVEVVPDGAGLRSTISCDGESFDGVDGDWYADARGIWRVGYDDADDARALDAAVMLAQPVAFRDEHADPAEPEADGVEEVAEGEHGWCRLSATTYGDEGWTQICFDDGAISYVERGTCGYECFEHHVTLRAR